MGSLVQASHTLAKIITFENHSRWQPEFLSLLANTNKLLSLQTPRTGSQA